MKNLITSIMNRVRKLMKEYESLYREVYNDPNYSMIERYSISGAGYY